MLKQFIKKYFTSAKYSDVNEMMELRNLIKSGGGGMQEARNKIEKSLKNNYFWLGREWPYKNVKPRIIAEKYMEDGAGGELIDYKFFCFNGEPKFLYVSQGMDNHATASMSFLTLDWRIAQFSRTDYKTFDYLPEKPQKFDLMLQIARELSGGIPFVRVDLYSINQEIYFSEMTFFPNSGWMPLEPGEWDLKLGELIKLPSI